MGFSCGEFSCLVAGSSHDKTTFNESVVFVKEDDGWRIQGSLGLRGGLIKVGEKAQE